MLTNGETTRMRLIPKTARYKAQRGRMTVPARLKVEAVADWLGCSVANVRDIESAKVGRKLKNGERLIRQLTPEQAEIVADQTGVNRLWLLDNDPSKPILNWRGEPYDPKDFARRQQSLKRVALARQQDASSFANPKSIGEMFTQQRHLAEKFAMLAAIMLRGIERGQADIYDYKLGKALRKIYGDTQPGEDAHEMGDLVMKACFHGNPTRTRPDVGPLLDAWEARFKEIANRKSGGKLPLVYLPQAKSLPAVRPAVSKPTGKTAKHPASKPAKRKLRRLRKRTSGL
jgi:hypothetical protein